VAIARGSTIDLTIWTEEDRSETAPIRRRSGRRQRLRGSADRSATAAICPVRDRRFTTGRWLMDFTSHRSRSTDRATGHSTPLGGADGPRPVARPDLAMEPRGSAHGPRREVQTDAILPPSPARAPRRARVLGRRIGHTESPLRPWRPQVRAHRDPSALSCRRPDAEVRAWSTSTIAPGARGCAARQRTRRPAVYKLTQKLPRPGRFGEQGTITTSTSRSTSTRRWRSCRRLAAQGRLSIAPMDRRLRRPARRARLAETSSVRPTRPRPSAPPRSPAEVTDVAAHRRRARPRDRGAGPHGPRVRGHLGRRRYDTVAGGGHRRHHAPR